MIAKSFHVVNDFLFYICEKCIVRWVGHASEDEILPHKYSFFIGQLIKIIILVGAAAPHADKIHVGFGQIIEEPVVVCFILFCAKNFAGNVVGTFCKQRNIIYFKIK